LFIFGAGYFDLSDKWPIGAAFVELYFVLSSIFASRAYYAFGFMALTASVVMLTTATVTILFTYFILCAEEYRLRLIHWLSAICCDTDYYSLTDGTGEHS
jgi:Endomembrane protein 70